jgi:hypothetical protein
LVKGLLSRRVPLRVFVVAAPGEAVELGVMEGEPGHFHVLPLGEVAEKLSLV